MKKLDVLKPIVIAMLQPMDNSLPFWYGKTPLDIVNENLCIAKSCYNGNNALSFVQKCCVLHLTIEIRLGLQVDILRKRWFCYYSSTNINSIICYFNFNYIPLGLELWCFQSQPLNIPRKGLSWVIISYYTLVMYLNRQI